jgi:CRP-like cAMP-binding protein
MTSDGGIGRQIRSPVLTNAPESGRWSNRLLAALPQETLAILERDFKEVALAQGAVCFEAGDLIDQIYFPQSGMISLLVTTGAGEMVEAATIGREGAAGMQSALGERRSFTRATIQVAGRFSTISAARFERVASGSSAIRDLVFRYTETLWAEAQQTAACNAVHNGSSRLCRWLLQTADRIGSDQIPLTQELLAEMLGVRRTTVTLLAQELQREGLLKYSRGRIALLDRAAIEDRACECYKAIKHDNLSRKLGIKL